MLLCLTEASELNIPFERASCEVNNGDCSANAKCIATTDGRICLCQDGFVGNGFQCRPTRRYQCLLFLLYRFLYLVVYAEIHTDTGWAKLNGANAVSFVVVKHVFREFR